MRCHSRLVPYPYTFYFQLLAAAAAQMPTTPTKPSEGVPSTPDEALRALFAQVSGGGGPTSLPPGLFSGGTPFGAGSAAPGGMPFPSFLVQQSVSFTHLPYLFLLIIRFSPASTGNKRVYSSVTGELYKNYRRPSEFGCTNSENCRANFPFSRHNHLASLIFPSLLFPLH